MGNIIFVAFYSDAITLEFSFTRLLSVLKFPINYGFLE